MSEKPVKASGFVVFPSGKEAEQITISDSAKGFGAVTVVPLAASG